MHEDPERKHQHDRGSEAKDKKKDKKKKDVLCGWEKDSFLKDYDRFRRIVENSRFACKKCGRVAAEATWLCKPIRLT